jgi:hypothetical protein
MIIKMLYNKKIRRNKKVYLPGTLLFRVQGSAPRSQFALQNDHRSQPLQGVPDRIAHHTYH